MSPEWMILRVFYELQGTDNQRKILLKNLKRADLLLGKEMHF